MEYKRERVRVARNEYVMDAEASNNTANISATAAAPPPVQSLFLASGKTFYEYKYCI